jgi:catechol 2,3-dioxygenase-like lactoylglutathione lyase family enzyme
MAFHHVAIATRDLKRSHRFYSDAIGFALVHVEVISTPGEGWARHVFYDSGEGGLLALFDLHDATITDYRTDLSTGLGLPAWVNHIAFAVAGPGDLDVRRQRLLAHGHDCMVIDHGHSVSLYATDPNGIVIEFCAEVRSIVSEANRARADELLLADRPPVDGGPLKIEMFPASTVVP